MSEQEQELTAPAEPKAPAVPRTQWVLARIFSLLFHPLIMPTVGVWLVFNLESFLTSNIPVDSRWKLYFLIFLNTFIVPVMIALYMLRTKMISTLSIVDREERWFPFLMTGGFYFFTYYLLLRFGVHQGLLSIMFGASVAVFVAFAINFRYKVSIHMVGCSGLVGVMFGIGVHYDLQTALPMLALIMVCGLVGFARLTLKVHTVREVYLGFLTGAICEALAVMLEWG